MTEWKRRSVRYGLVADDGPYEGIQEHMKAPLEQWLKARHGWFRSGRYGGIRRALVLSVASAVRVPVKMTTSDADLSRSLISACLSNEEVFLDVLDATLHFTSGEGHEALEQALHTANSVWTVDESERSLERRVDLTAREAKINAISQGGAAATEIAQAWRNTFSREPDPSDAWDHAAKAVEAALIPIVVPHQDKPHLGHVLGQLRKQKERWRLVLPGPTDDHGIDPLLEMLDLIWPNPDRHASDTSRSPSLREAQAVVHLAVTIVQWAHMGAVSRWEDSKSAT